MTSSEVPEAHQAIPATRVDQVRVVRIELAREDFVGVGRLQVPMADLLHLGHSCFVVDLDVGLRAGDTELTKVFRKVDGVKTVFFVQTDVLDRVSHI